MGMGKGIVVKKSGFTMIEVSLFLALSGAILVASLIGITTTISNQRYREAGADALDFFSGVYSKVTNPQHYDETGNDYGEAHQRAIYGQAIVLAEDGSTAHTYAVSGSADIDVVSNALKQINIKNGCTNVDQPLLAVLNYQKTDSGDFTCNKKLDEAKNALAIAINDSTPESHTFQWQANLLDTKYNNDSTNDLENHVSEQSFGRIILIMRDPSTNIIKTFVSKDNDWSLNAFVGGTPSVNSVKFKIADVHICVRTPDAPSVGYTDIRIDANARNGSMVNSFSFDDREHNKCQI